MAIKATFLLPDEINNVLEELPARIRLDSGVKITKTELLVNLVRLLRSAKINTKKVHSVDDIIDQLKGHIRKGK